ncbi:MAG: ferritin [Thermodesulfobacteriota bacterium]
MLSEKMAKALNSQVNAELYSSYFYLAMNSYFESVSLGGFAHWMRYQAQEEMLHAMKIYDYLHERGGKAELTVIEQPPQEWHSAGEVFADVLAHEQKVTGLINDLVDLAMAERDHAATAFLQWFVTEQVEEEANVGGVVEKLRLIGSDTSGLFTLDQEMATRQPPTVE